MDDLNGMLDSAMASLESSGFKRAADAVERASNELTRLRAEVEALKAENERQFTALNDWLYANGPNGWIDLLRHELAAMTTEVEALRAERQVLNSAVVAAKSETAEFAEVAINAQNEVEALRADADRLDCGQIMIDTRDEFGEPKQVWHTGMNLRAAIDAARAAREGRG